MVLFSFTLGRNRRLSTLNRWWWKCLTRRPSLSTPTWSAARNRAMAATGQSHGGSQAHSHQGHGREVYATDADEWISGDGHHGDVELKLIPEQGEKPQPPPRRHGAASGPGAAQRHPRPGAGAERARAWAPHSGGMDGPRALTMGQADSARHRQTDDAPRPPRPPDQAR